MKIRELELLIRVADTGSMTTAARQLNITPAAVSATVQRVEEAVGIRVFERTTRSLHPTDEGAAFIEGCRDTLREWRQTLDRVRGESELEGTVHLGAPADTTYSFIGAVLAAFSDAHPRVRVVMHASDSVQDVHREAIDLAIRYGPLPDSTLSARKLVDSARVLVASPAYIEAHGAPESPEQIANHRALTLLLSERPVTTWTLQRGTRRVDVNLDSPLVGDGHLVRRWTLDGVGLAFRALVDVIDDLESGALVWLLPDWAGASMPVHRVFPSRRFVTGRVRAVDEAVAECFADRAARCEAFIAARASRTAQP